MNQIMDTINETKKIGQSVISIGNHRVYTALITKFHESCKPIISKSIKSLYFRKKFFFFDKILEKSNIPSTDSIILRSAHADPQAMKDILKLQPHKSDLYNNRIKDKNLQCLASFAPKGKLVGWCWFASEQYYESTWDFTFTLNPGCLYQFDGIVVPEFRRKKLGSLSLSVMWDFLIDNGYTTTSALVDSSNIPALRLHDHMGFIYRDQNLIIHYIFKKPFPILRYSAAS
jgi:ribosomal protein S18 acetylase RimI-like enzyme